jgi:oligopeptide/dipeptide ABC transporter ATP-binding protein
MSGSFRARLTSGTGIASPNLTAIRPNVPEAVSIGLLRAGKDTPLPWFPLELLPPVPVPNPKLKRAKRLSQSDVPSPINPPPGCAFHTRCPYAEARCKVDAPHASGVMDPARELPYRPAADHRRIRGRTDGSIRLRATTILKFSLPGRGRPQMES